MASLKENTDPGQKGETAEPLEGTKPVVTKYQRRRQKSQKAGKKKRIRSADEGYTSLPSSLDPSLYINRELSWLEFNHR
ncbi:MAG: Polyphosphate kinase N-terminal domain, partial [Bacteroidetes bacterium]|nr:Polyphosphate kinase N-terminal domain [Bacteroidota bacterium]